MARRRAVHEVIGGGARARTGRRRRWAVAIAAVAVAISGCGSTTGPADPAPPAATAAVASSPGHGPAPLPAPPPHPRDDGTSSGAALVLASAAVAAFARPDIDADRWWSELAPLLSPAAATAYEGTDPLLVPAREVTGPPRSGESPSSYLATVFVPTDAGEYAVLMVRDGGGAPWLVERITRVADDASPVPAPATGGAGA